MKTNPIALSGGESPETSIGSLEQLMSAADTIFVKKLTRNDRSWSWESKKGTHQGGPYIPARERDSGFFPDLKLKERSPGEDDIREVFFSTYWPQTGETRKSRLVHYTSKGEETHLTGLSKQPFKTLAPASFLLLGKISSSASGPIYHCLTIDSTSDDAVLLEDTLSLGPDFICEIAHPTEKETAFKEQQLTFLELVLRAFRDGRIAEFVREYATIPNPAEMAARARKQYCERYQLSKLDPFDLPNPGDVIREISRGVEWELFKDVQLKARSLNLLGLIVGHDPKEASIERVIASLVNNYQKIDAVLLSASQQRKARAGASFEHHIEQLLLDGNIPYEKQVVLESKRRPDFILPSLALFKSNKRAKETVVVLSAKTTLRERWKQVQSEIENCCLFLATVDENVAGNAIQDMHTLGIVLVVPEALKRSGITDYAGHSNVIDFKTFFEVEVRNSRLEKWKH